MGSGLLFSKHCVDSKMYSCTSENRVGAFSCEYLGQASSESNATCVGINNNNDDSIRSYKAFCNYNSRVVNKFYSDNTCTSEKQTEVVYAAAPNNDNCVCPGGPSISTLSNASCPNTCNSNNDTNNWNGANYVSLLCNNSLVYSCTGQNQTRISAVVWAGMARL